MLSFIWGDQSRTIINLTPSELRVCVQSGVGQVNVYMFMNKKSIINILSICNAILKLVCPW